ncbi:hypothetical protein RND81_08G160700 [Saponaria officinalis]|uniref:F-box domain-containing protein n=1 Tax=Saponaria officinalis TaxID=3572 RepID=A0AAW1J801_SAPOF
MSKLTKATFSCVPDDVMEEIFHKLHYKEICASKLVCKNWNSIISSPKFIDKYSTHLLGNHLILLDDTNSSKSNFYTLNWYNLVDDRSISSIAAPIDDPQISDINRLRLIGSYNGLVALSCHDKLILWNPLTGKYSSIKVPNVSFSNWFGLCYNCDNDVYSVVVGENYYTRKPPTLYSFKDFGREKVIKNSSSVTVDNRFKGDVGKVICGLPYWVVINSDLEIKIIYFDLKRDMFRQMAPPYCCDKKKLFGLATVDEENQLGCVLHDLVNSCLEVWVMTVYRKVRSWINLFKFSYQNLTRKYGYLRYMDVVGIIPSGELLLCLEGEKVCVYDVKKGKCRKINLQGIKLAFVAKYRPSFVSPPEVEVGE